MAIIDKFSEDELVNLVGVATSKKDLAYKLGYGTGGSSWKTIQKRLDGYEIDWSHLLKAIHKSYEGGGTKPRPIEDYLIEHSTANRRNLKKRLLEEGYLENKCSECGLTEDWKGKPLKMHLDHINGVNNDNRIHNLRMLCPNCHSQTGTYAGSNSKIKLEPYLEDETFNQIYEDFMDDSLKIEDVYQRNNITDTILKKVLTNKGLSYRRTDHGVYYKPTKSRLKVVNTCKDCGKEVSRKAERCKECAGKVMGENFKVVKDRPSVTELHNLLLTKPFTAVGKLYGVSDNAVRKWCKGYGIPHTATYYRELDKKEDKSKLGYTYTFKNSNRVRNR